MLSIVIGMTGIAFSLPLGILLALGRRSDMFLVKSLCVGFIEFIRGVPLITLLLVASFLLNIFLPPGTNFDIILRVIIMVTLFSAAYMAETIRGGLAALPRGQYEAADALGLDYWKAMRLIIMPQALKISIPNIVSNFISLFKDTTLVAIIALLDPIGLVTAIRADTELERHRLGALRLRGADLLPLLLQHVALFEATSSASCAPTTAEEASHGRSPSRRRLRARARRHLQAQGLRRAGDPDHRHEQVVRPVPRAARHRPHRLQGRADRGLRAVGLGQVDADPLHQPAGGAPEGPDHRRRGRIDERSQEHRQGALRGRDGVPALQPLPAPDHPRELHPRPDLGPQDPEEGGRGGGDALPDARSRSPSRRRNTRASSRAASSSGWRSRGRSACGRRSCSSTSRPRRSTRR